ncbi:MAG: amidohydrolase family protein [Planctomycetes bacterium]|nr:amidohydrolase family protein [Planctomycetota bacterium]
MIILKAHVVISPEAPDIDNGSVVIEDAHIKAVGPWQELRPQFPRADLIDLSDSALLPGLVNAHTHLELSFLKDKVPYRDSFTDWIRQLTAARKNRDGELAHIIADACRQSLQGGVTTIGDICYEHRAWSVLAAQPIRKTCFAECFGLTEELEPVLEYLGRCIRETTEDPLLRLGISPHAPYSAGSGLYRAVAQLAKAHHLPLTTHLAETR